MLDPLAQQVGIGGAVAVLLVSAVMKFLPAFMTALRQNGKHSSGSLSPEEWEGRMERLNSESEERLMIAMRALMDTRTLILVEKVTQPIVNEIRGLRDDLRRGLKLER